MGGQRHWPHRFRVTVRTRGGRSVTYPVVSWLSEAKAIGMAVTAHQRRSSGAESAHAVADVEVTDLGPVARNPDGTTALDRSDIVDRYEF